MLFLRRSHPASVGLNQIISNVWLFSSSLKGPYTVLSCWTRCIYCVPGQTFGKQINYWVILSGSHTMSLLASEQKLTTTSHHEQCVPCLFPVQDHLKPQKYSTVLWPHWDAFILTEQAELTRTTFATFSLTKVWKYIEVFRFSLKKVVFPSQLKFRADFPCITPTF